MLGFLEQKDKKPKMLSVFLDHLFSILQKPPLMIFTEKK